MPSAYKILTVVPCFLIAYAFLRRKAWGRFLLIAYNGFWVIYVTYALIAELATDPKSIDTPPLIAVIVIYSILGSLIALAWQRDIKAHMTA